ncbi:chymotrypsin-like protease CTRL-1 [Convolutriloba macropyga]|uniref:chymotrypsin-like protease CTRL-1 n=1 Tax=Convolutriloba macropyga TaxID=536237 RepID=UPI003F522990
MKKIPLFTFFLSIIIPNQRVSCGEPSAHVSKRGIINGYTAPQRDFYVLIELTFHKGIVKYCGGTIISISYVLTAAHCVMNYLRVHVLVGDFSIRWSTKKRISATAISHESFNTSTKWNDIALLKLSERVSSRLSLPICNRDYSYYDIGVCGMGETRTGNNPHVLQAQFLLIFFFKKI